MSEVYHLYRPGLKTRLIFSIGILAVLALWITAMYIVFGGEKFGIFMGIFAVYFAPGFGKESLIPIMTAVGCPLAAIVSGIVILDMTLAILISFNFDLLLKIPGIGHALRYATDKSATTLHDHPWVKGLAGTGLFLFMYIPFMGSSAIITTIIGRLLAVHPKVLLPIIFSGSLCATLTVAVGVKAVIALWFANPWYAVIAVIVTAIVIVLIWKLWQKFIAPRFAKDTK
ncbi:MAG: hypothetical protein IJE95_08000 [Methanocorpusculum sp.]|nr:hypothetical protein [Methanocorpusculum sp.]